MEAPSFKLLSDTGEHAPFDFGYSPEQRRIEFDLSRRFDEREFWNQRIEFQLETLQQDGMVNITFSSLPTQNPIAYYQLDFLALALDMAPDFIELLEDSHRRPRGLFCARPSRPR